MYTKGLVLSMVWNKKLNNSNFFFYVAIILRVEGVFYLRVVLCSIVVLKICFLDVEGFFEDWFLGMIENFYVWDIFFRGYI